MESDCTPSNLDTVTRTTSISNLDIETLTPVPPEIPTPHNILDTTSKRSWVWQYFQTTVIGGVAYNICQARKSPEGEELCLRQLTVDSKKSTTSMSKHLDRIHHIYENKQSTGAITKFLEKGCHFKKLDRSSLTSSLARFFVGCNVPFYTVEDPHFHQLLRLCNPAIDEFICGKDTLSAFIRKTFRQGKQVLCDQLCALKSQISLTCDTWTSPSNQSVLGVTAHWIDEDFSLNSIILAARLVDGNHSGVSLANHLLEVLEDFDICDQIFCITSDNASNNRTMGAHLATLIPFDNEKCLLGCMAHVINLAAQAGIKEFSQSSAPSTALPDGLMSILNDQPAPVEVKTIISRIKGFASFLKHSPQKAALFAKATIRVFGEEIHMVQDVATRWNSTFYMLKRASELQACISTFCEAHHLSDQYNLQPHEWLKLNQLCSFMGLLHDATNTISPENTVTLSLAAPVYIMMMKELRLVSSL
jgi:hypothetical protein